MDQSGTFLGAEGEGKCVNTNGFHFSSGASSSRLPTL